MCFFFHTIKSLKNTFISISKNSPLKMFYKQSIHVHAEFSKVQFACAKIHTCKYTPVCKFYSGVSKWRMPTQIHTGVYLHMGKFTPGSDQMQFLFLQIPVCKFTILSHVNLPMSIFISSQYSAFYYYYTNFHIFCT